jgi:RHS repeat-associated protein
LNGTTDYEYGQLSAAADSSSAGPNCAYDHDNIGNVTRESKAGTSTYFGYNRTGQLCYKSTTDGDNIGTGTACPTAPSGATTYTHDAAGNNLMGGAAYNNRNQVTDLDSLSMGYLDLGNDQRTTVGTTTIADGPLGITGRKTGTTVTWYTRMPDGMILDSRQEGGGTTQVYFTEPHSQSVTALFSLTGTMTAAYLYSPYGETTIHSEDSGAGTDNPFRYISGWQDTGTSSFYKLGARYYDGHGHFTQHDPLAGSLADPSTMTGYNYASGDPINSSDPSGLCRDGGQWDGPCTETCLDNPNRSDCKKRNPPRGRSDRPPLARLLSLLAYAEACFEGAVFVNSAVVVAKTPQGAVAATLVGCAGGMISQKVVGFNILRNHQGTS